MRHPKDSYVTAVKGSPNLYYVRAVPQDVRAAEEIGKSKWSIPLHTNSRAKAIPMARAIAVEHDALIEKLRRPDPLEVMSAVDRKRVEDSGGVEAFLARQRTRWQGANLALNIAEMTRDYPPDSGDPAFVESEAAAFETTARVLETAIVADGSVLSQFGVTTPKRLRTSACDMTGDAPLTFSELCEKYLSARSPRNKGAYRNVAVTFEKLNGKLLLADITKKHVRAYRDSLPAAGYIESSAKGCFKKLKTMFIYAVADDHLQQNPAATLMWSWPFTQSLAEADDRRRRTFSYEEARWYLKAAENLSLTNRTRWFILLMMYSGARGEEIGQLSPGDVNKIGDVWCISIHDRDWRTLKTAGSLRDVPIHKTVLDQGFLAFVDSRKGRQLIFSDRLATKETRCYPRNAEDLRKLLRKTAKITDSRVVPYSSRHTAKDCLRLVEAPKYVEDRILGHASAENKVADGYGEAQIMILKKWLDKIDPFDNRRTTTTFKDEDD
ncbi:MAG: phage integrase SAM-like domain-containing protein [Roseiarcus sp.]